MQYNAQITETLKQYHDKNYGVSNLEKKKKKKTKLVLATEDTGNGYLYVGLQMPDGTYKKARVHRLVAMTFLEFERTEERNEVDHINGCKTDNYVENLRWCTHKENMNNPITLNKIRRGVRRRYQKLECLECTKFYNF